MKKPTKRELKAFFQGYDFRQQEAMAAATEAAQKRKSTPAAVRDSYRRSEWELKAEAQLRANRETTAESASIRARIGARLARFNAEMEG